MIIYKLGQVTKMAAVAIYGKNPTKTLIAGTAE